ncbi:glycosyltransferase family 2 protein [Telmatospirillum sp.]|uniref:glycosyltransferase family 2 protein n=1 Tax=Telmatospirillum sp. TaxID=2079197 RepID=UPI00283F019B|nr:glycosyltransferase family 2 protein [Telmatospirillum sp.]MDR3439942.1 glycosyltransferase family 2 protein [Telmatospirillum sp.]
MSFSVVIPAYNRAQYISETIENILHQSLKPEQIIVVNDGSTDDTHAVVSEKYGNVVDLIDIPNSGPPGARDAGVRAARQEFIAFCDSDDLWLPDHLERLGRLLRHGDVSFAFSNFVYFKNEVRADKSQFDCDPARFYVSPGRSLGDGMFISDVPLFPHVLEYQPILPSCTAIKKEYYLRVGGYDHSFGRVVSEDLEFTLRCVREGGIGIDTHPTAEIRRHSENHSGDWIRCLAGSIDILKYSILHHGLSRDWQEKAKHQIAVRSLEGIDHAFLSRRFEDISLFSKEISIHEMKIKQFIKIVISRCPRNIALFLQKVLTRGS